MSTLIKPIDVIPSQNSGTSDWTAYWDGLVSRYGKNDASTVFAVTWRKFRGGKADLVKVREHTKLPLDNESLLDSLSSAESSVGDFLGGIGTTYKYGLIALTGIFILTIGGIAYRLVTASAKEVGEAAGTAAKTLA